VDEQVVVIHALVVDKYPSMPAVAVDGPRKPSP
jgi:hypothetical protein